MKCDQTNFENECHKSVPSRPAIKCIGLTHEDPDSQNGEHNLAANPTSVNKLDFLTNYLHELDIKDVIFKVTKTRVGFSLDKFLPYSYSYNESKGNGLGCLSQNPPLHLV